jgi:hypothetical protein
MRIALAATALTALAGACAPHDGLAGARDADRRALAEARPAGEPVSCIPIAQISHTRVLDERTIDFHMHGGRSFRNQLPHACPGLGFERSFSYRTSLDRLCSTDLIRVNHPQGMGATCGLGQFQPIETAHR